MADDGQGQALNGQQGQVPENQPGQGSTPTEGQDPEAEAFDKARALSTIRAQREQEKQLRQRLSELEALTRKHDEEKMSENERLHSKLSESELKITELERERQELVLRHETIAEAAKVGVVDPDVAYRLLDTATVEFDGSGKPTNLTALIKELVKSKPYLTAKVTNGSVDGTAGRGQPRTDIQPGYDRIRFGYEEAAANKG
jgi:vacuolar-type H+-ATPase subunit I/STV1